MKEKSSVLRLFERGIKEGFSNIWRNKVLSIATVFVIGIIIFIFNVILAVNLIAQDSLQNLSKKIDIVVYVKESSTFSDIQTIKAELSQLEGVEKVVYTTKDQALNQLKSTHPDLTLAFEKYNLGNPLPASLNITTIHPQYHETIAEVLSQDRYKKYLSNIISNDSENNKILSSVSKNLLEVTNFTQSVIFWLVVTFIIGGTLIILNALQLTIFTRKKEIGIMKLVGASHWFIRLPFIIESILYGIIAVSISFLMLYLISQNIQIEQTSFWNYYSSLDFIVIFLIELGITILLSIASSIIAVHEHLQKMEV